MKNTKRYSNKLKGLIPVLLVVLLFGLYGSCKTAQLKTRSKSMSSQKCFYSDVKLTKQMPDATQVSLTGLKVKHLMLQAVSSRCSNS